LDASPANVPEAYRLRQLAIDEATSEKSKAPKRPPKIEEIALNLAVEQFFEFYCSEHKNRPCKWAKSLLSAFTFYFTDPATFCPLSKIDASKMEDFKVWRRGNPVHDNTLRKNLLLIGQFFSYARKKGWIVGDPFTFVDASGHQDKVKIPAEDKTSQVWHILTPTEEKTYLAAAASLRNLDLFDTATIEMYQGARPGEILGLHKGNVDLANREFTIWFSTNEGKSKNAHRTLNMTKQTYPIFVRRMALSGDWLFPSARKDGTHTVTLQKAHEKVLAKLGLHWRIYDMRHTFATRFALRGGNLTLLSQILGHADLEMLMRYVHPSKEDRAAAMAAFSDSFPDVAELESLLVDYHVEQAAGEVA
jgi:integrase